MSRSSTPLVSVDPFILLVEDSPLQRRQYQAQLSGNGYPVVAVADGAEALAYLKLHRSPAALVVDWELPDLTGLQLLVLVRAMDFRVRPYVIMLTQRSQTDSVVVALSRGADDYLVKPPAPAELESRLRVAIRSFHLHAELVDRVAELEAASKRETIQATIISGPVPPPDPPKRRPEECCLDAAIAVLNRVQLRVLGSRSVGSQPEHDYVAWAGLAVPSKAIWLDLTLYAEASVLAASAITLAGRVGENGISLPDLLAELASLVRAHLRAQFFADDYSAISATLPRCFAISRAPALQPTDPARHYTLEVAEGVIGFCVQIGETVARKLPVSALDSGLLVTRELRAPGRKGVMLKAGTVLSGRLIRRLGELEAQLEGELVVEVVRPSEYAKRAMQGRTLASMGPMVR